MTRRSFSETAGRAVVLTALLALSVGSATASAALSSSGISEPVAGEPDHQNTRAEESVSDDPYGVNRLVEQLKDAATQRAARDALVSIGSPVVEDLVLYLGDPDMTVRWEVATILGTIGDETAVPALIKRVVEDENPHVRWRSLWSLTRFGDARVSIVNVMRHYLESEAEGQRWNAAIALSMFDEDDGVPLFHAGVGHFKPWRRWEAINALGRVHDRATVQVLAGVLESDHERDRQEAVLSLGKIASERAVLVLVGALNDPSEDVRWRACLALGRAADPIAREPLTALVEAGDQPRVMQHARDALERINRSAG